MEDYLGKNYVLVSSENFDDYLSFIGVGFLARKAAAQLKPVQCLRVNSDGTYTFTYRSMLVNSEITFTPGEEFEETKPDGVKVRATIRIEDNKMIHTQIEKSGRTSTHVREFFPNKMTVTTTVEGFDKVVLRCYKPQP